MDYVQSLIVWFSAKLIYVRKEELLKGFGTPVVLDVKFANGFFGFLKLTMFDG
jgi:hypothetical protein